ncbi:MAG TPA: hypothetical protein VFA12_09215 [Stellaceae bacterium]|nr:hypothetical protein [Stellaceae bacterium]
MLDHLRLRVAEIIRPKDPVEAPPHAALPPAAGADADNSLVQRLREIVATSGSALAGRINLLGLSHIKQHFGDAWQRVADRAERIARNTIERRLSPRDIYGKWDDFDFVLILADLDTAAAQVKCALIAQEIARALVGEEGAELIEVKSAVVRLDGELDFASVPIKGALLHTFNQAQQGAAVPVPEADAAEPAPDPLAGLHFRYRPMWDPVRRSSVVFQCTPLIAGDNCDRAVGPIVAGDPVLKGRVDIAARQKVLAEVKRLRQAGHPLMLVVPVHFESLAKLSARLDYMKALDELSPEEQHLVLFELLEVPPGVVYSRLFDLVGPLRSRCYGVVACVDLDCRNFGPIKQSGLRAVGVDLAAHPTPEDALIRQAQRFERASFGTGLFAYAHGVRTPAMLQALRGSFAYLSGDAIAPLMDTPGRIASLDPEG